MNNSLFVVRAKTNIKSKVLKWKRGMPKNITSDCKIELTGYYSQKYYPERYTGALQKTLYAFKSVWRLSLLPRDYCPTRYTIETLNL